MAKKVADTNINILITGESGTGKEMIAQSIHNESGRLGSFFPVNCAAIPKELMESEFFGYEKGSFTGALKEGKIGIFELANNGTILLDEIGELPLFMQSKILRFLQDGIFYRVGGHTPIKVDVRILAATNKELKELIEKGKFRKDLFYRLNSIHIELPPLRERIGDIKFLAEKFIIEFCNLYKVNQFVIPHNLYNDLKNNKWEGNIRELRSLMERYVVMKKKGILDTFNYVEQTSVDSQMGEIATMDFNERVKSLENNLINEAISISGGNISKAARILNIPRTTLINKMSSKGHVSK
jgi:transcriptional regulator with PAS, ATPase and Fis domain